MDQVHVIRHKVLVEGRTQRSVAREMAVSRTTVRKYVDQAAPARQERRPRARPVWAKVGPRIQELLAASKDWTGGKQQLTATRLRALLIAEGQPVGVTLVKDAVAEWKRSRREVMIPLTYRPGDLAEVDFFEVLVDVAAARRSKNVAMLMRLMRRSAYGRKGSRVDGSTGTMRDFLNFVWRIERIPWSRSDVRPVESQRLTGTQPSGGPQCDERRVRQRAQSCWRGPSSGFGHHFLTGPYDKIARDGIQGS